ncbi:MAG: putative bifunctional diguanylate cyclase/phosphodiesterase [Pseudomonadota bacterium]
MAQERDELSRLREALSASGDIVYNLDLVCDRLAWSGGAAELFGAGAGSPATGEAFTHRIHVEDLEARGAALTAHIRERREYDCEYRLRGEQGLVWVHDRGSIQFSREGRPVRLLGALRVVTRRKQKEARLEYLANFDELTGHLNRARVKEALDLAIAYGTRYQAPGAYLSVGIDKLTEISDGFGHETADVVILGVGERLNRVLRASDIVGRIGGDRFGVVLSHCPENDLARAAGKILEAMGGTAIDTQSGPIHVSVSIGACSFLDAGASAYEAMSRADSALLEAKQAGRNCFVRFAASAARRERRRQAVTIAEEVQAALKADRLLLAYQPVIDACAGTIEHYECLLRLRRSDGSLMPAAMFVPVAEQSGLIRMVDRHALDLAVHELAAHAELKLAINISGLTAADRSWFRSLKAHTSGRPEIARRLIVEITETVALQDLDEAARLVSAVRELGCSVSLDDFGAGYTSFRNLKVLAVNSVKIDGSFVKDLGGNVDNQLFVRTLLGLAEGFGLATVAEGVESAADAAELTRRGVRFLQGYFFGRPMLERAVGMRPILPHTAAVPELVQ